MSNNNIKMARWKRRKTFKELANDAAIVLGMVAVFGTLIYAVIPKADPEGATSTLEDAGYKNVVINGAQWTGCGNGDVFKTSFSATGVTGRQVNGVVCSGFWKGKTIRTY